ncbi:MAG: hypothetical protein ACJ8C3_15595 [Microvirga sp.]
MFLIAIAFLGLIAFGVGWALLGNMAGTLLVTFAWFGTEFDRFLTGLVIVGPALGAVCMVAAIWFSLRASGRCKTRREMLRAGGGALTIILGLGATAFAANAIRMELYKAKYNLSYTHVAFELRLPAETKVPENKDGIVMTLSTPVLASPAIFGARWLSPEWLRQDEGDRPVIMAWRRCARGRPTAASCCKSRASPSAYSASTCRRARPSGGIGPSGNRSRR